MRIQPTVWVVNQTDQIHVDRFDGEDVVFRPLEAVQLPTDVARFFFGYGVADKTPALQRLGWLNHPDPAIRQGALSRLNQFIIHEQHPLLAAKSLPASAPASVSVPPAGALPKHPAGGKTTIQKSKTDVQ